MQTGFRRLILPLAGGVIVVGAAIVLLARQAGPACGAYTLTASAPVTLDDGVSLSVPAGELRFDGAVLAEADLTSEANAQILAAVGALPVNLRTQGAILAFTRCGESAVPVHLESAAPAPALDAYAWDGTRWTWLAGSTDKLSVDLPDLPQIVAWAQSLPTAPTIGAEPDPQTGGLAPEYVGVITELYAPGLNVTANGAVAGQVPAAPPPGSPYVVYPVIRNLKADGQADADAVAAMLNNAAARQTHVDTLTSIAGGSNFAGVALDYRGAIPSEAFAAFVEELSVALHAQGKLLVVVLPMPGPGSQTPFDWARLGRVADVVQIELPLEASFYQPGDSIRSVLDWAGTKLDRNKLQPVLSSASVGVVSGSSSAWSFRDAAQAFIAPGEPAAMTATLGTSATLSLSGPAPLAFEAASGVYSVGDSNRQMNLHSAATLAYKLNALSGLRLRGAVIRDVQGQAAAPNLLEPIKAYRQQTRVTGSSELSVNWSIIAADGSSVLNETRPLASASLVWTPDRDGTFTVKATIASATRDVTLVTVGKGSAAAGGTSTGGASGGEDICYNATYVTDVTIPDNTRFDKGKDFTKTWRVRNTGECAWSADTELAFASGSQLGGSSPVKVGPVQAGKTVDVSVPMKSGDRDGAFTGFWQLRNKDGAFGDRLSVVIRVGAEVVAPPVAPPAGGGRTEFGVHAHFYGYLDTDAGAASIASYTGELGLGWVKIQFRWGDYDYYCGGADLNVLGGMINRANAAGLKVMLSIVTAPPCTHPWTAEVHAPPDNPNDFAETVAWLVDNFKGRIHAIEIWNEQNIDREWKTSPQVLDANRYTQMLAASYNAIKSRDPNILVISGALAPTGFNNGVTATDDFTYLQQMVAAGAAKYMDCVGTHVNALRVPPSAGQGGPYDSLFSPPHHSWFFKDTVQGYQSITGKPACVTEFGVATQEGVGAVAGFEWAADNTQQEQADWVTEGMTLCRQWGCRLMILWNLDYGPATGQVNDNALYSFLDMGWNRRPVFPAVKNWCAANGCR